MEIGVNTKAKILFTACLLVAAITVAIWYLISASHYATYRVQTREPVSGLIAEAPIEFHGVEVGKVKSVRLVDAQTVDILLSIDKSTPVTAATVATITSHGLATRGFTGYVFIALENVGADAGPLLARPGDPYPTIAAAPSKSMTLDTVMSQTADNLQTVTTLLASLLDKGTISSLTQSAENLQKITQAMAENTKKMDDIVANTERASRQFEPLMKSTRDTVNAFQAQILPESYRVLANLDNLSTTLTAVTNRINRDPSILLRGTAPLPGPGEKP